MLDIIVYLNSIHSQRIYLFSDIFYLFRSMEEEPDKYSLEEKKLGLTKPRKYTHDVMTSPVPKNESADLDTAGFREGISFRKISKSLICFHLYGYFYNCKIILLLQF